MEGRSGFSGVLVVLACALWLAVDPARGQATPDHLKCYKIRDALRLSGTLDLSSPQFGAESGCKASSTALFCVPAAKSNVSATNRATGTPITPLPFSAAPAGDDRICYRLKCPPPSAPIPDQSVTDQFGNRIVTRFGARLLCTPAVKGAGFCGNGAIDTGEQCDGANLNGATCASQGFPYGGALSCGPGCTFDTTGCRTAGLLATGQTTCWNTTGNAFPCAGSGQDGDLQKGAPLSYTDNGDGTITDNNTGLVWEKLGMDGSAHDVGNTYTWDEAFSGHVATLNGANFAGRNDWRLPNIRELQSIVNYQNVGLAVSPAFNTNCTAGCTVMNCSCTSPGGYWASSSVAIAPQAAWFVRFYTGTVEGGADKSQSVAFVRAVRGGS